MKRTDYETLAMEEIIVEMENGFLSASADVRNESNYAIENQSINTDFNINAKDGSGKDTGFAAGSWE